MTLDSMIVMLDDFLSYDLDNFKRRDGHTVTPEEKTKQINYGVRTISEFIYQFDPLITFILEADEQKYSLRDTDIFGKKIIEAKRVIINGVTLRRPDGERGLWKYAEVERYLSNWHSTDSSTPRSAWQLGDDLYLNPKPTFTNVSGGSNYVAGRYLAADLVHGEDGTPDLPEELHEAAVYCASCFASNPSVAEGEALSRLARYNGEWSEKAKTVRRRNRKMIADFGCISGSSRPEYTQ